MADKIKVVLTTRPVWLLLVAMAVALAIGLLIPVDDNMRGPLVDVTAQWGTASRGVYLSEAPTASGRATGTSGSTPVRLRLTYFR